MTYIKILLTFILLTSSVASSICQVVLPQIIKDGMVLQSDATIPIWGWASAGEDVRITFDGKQYDTTASSEGIWKLELPEMNAGGPYTMSISGKNNIQLKDIMIGDVWLCAGQSNMVHQMNIHDVTYAEDIVNANFPAIRQFKIPTQTNLEGPSVDLNGGSWLSAVSEDVRLFSAVAYFFARKLYEQYQVPIGLIDASVGGTPIEAWISEEGFEKFPENLRTIKQNKDTAYINGLTRQRRNNGNHASPQPQDKGLTGPTPWYAVDYSPKNWRRINIPGYWEDQGAGDLNGVVWYRKEIEIPRSMAGKPAKVFLGRIIDADQLYINGELVGNTTYQYPQRRYKVPVGLLKAGKNVFVVRVSNRFGKGGFVSDKPYCIFTDRDTVDLKGYWQYKVGEVFAPPSRSAFSGMRRINPQNQPTALYNAMVAPYIDFPIKGILWYQGESNAGRPAEYADLLPALASDWRAKFKNYGLPFIYAQLPGFMDVNYLPSESNWALLRESQFKGLQIPNSAMTVNIDLGEWNDIHPDNKKDVGERMALAAQKLAYKEDIVFSGPIYQGHKIEGNTIIISFSHLGSGLVADDGEPLSEFAIAGFDERFVWANAKIEQDKVIVWSDEIPHPNYVRYAWADNPDNPNLYNKEGLPASPFRNYDPDKIDENLWRGRKATVVLTYDDALNVHLDNAIPVLDALGLKGTFYVSSHSAAFLDRLTDWQRIAADGHELGNHTVFHPCDGTKPNRSWVNPNYDLSNYTVKRIVDEIRINNAFLQALDGKTKRTFAFTCGEMQVAGNEAFIHELENDLLAARAVRSEIEQADDIELYNIASFGINGESGDEMIELVKKAVANDGLLVFLFHGVGGEHNLDVSLPAHRQLLEYLKQHEDEIWTTTLAGVAQHIKNYRLTHK